MNTLLDIFPILFLPFINWFWYLFIFLLVSNIFLCQNMISSHLLNVLQNYLEEKYAQIIGNWIRFFTVNLHENFDVLLEWYERYLKIIQLFRVIVDFVKLFAILSEITVNKVLKSNIGPHSIWNGLKSQMMIDFIFYLLYIWQKHCL